MASHRSARMPIRLYLIIACLFFTLAGTTIPAAEAPAAAPNPETVNLATGKKALLPIVTGEKASERVKAAATTLAEYLGKISGATFTVMTGKGEIGIIVGVPADFPQLPEQVAFPEGPYHREDYILRSRKSGIWLLGATDLAVEHAVWDLLHRFGYRQFFPGKAWEVIPTLPRLSIAIDVTESPDYAHRRIWYNWGMQDYNRDTYKEWCARNRMAQGFTLNSGHAYDAIINANKAEFDAHPEYRALVKDLKTGESSRKGTKFCISNPGLRKLVVDWAVKSVKAKPQVDSISVDPSDGGGWCECDDCVKMGSVSDRALTLANDVAEAINALGLGDKYVGMYAYNFHCAPPTIKVHPKVIITATTAFITGGFTLDQIINGWQQQGATMGIYDYYSVSIWDWNMPGKPKASHPDAVANAIKKFYDKGARFYDCESGDCWGPSGLGYYIASRTMWDVTQADRVQEITEDFLTRAFGPAKEPMREFYALITGDTTFRSGSDLTGRMYRHLEKAKQLAAGRQDILMRIYQLVAYTRYVELRAIMSSPKADKDAKDRWLTFTYRLRKTSMVHYYGLWSDAIGQKHALDPQHPLKDETPFTQQELDTILREGIANNQPVEMGFTPVTFSQNLVPAASKLRLPEVAMGSHPTVPQDRQAYYIWVDKANTDFRLKVTVQRVWNLRPHHVKLFKVEDDGSETLLEDNTSVKPDGTAYDVVLRSPQTGLHRVEIIDGGDYTRIVWPDGLPVTLPSAIDTPTIGSHFRGAWSLYFYVPKGTKVVGGWAAGRTGTLVDSAGTVHLDFSKREDGWFAVPVPAGQDGTLWKFEKHGGRRQLMTVPPYLARNGNELLLPKEVVEKDAAK